MLPRINAIQSLRAFRRAHPEHPILPHFRDSRPLKNDRYGHLQSNALIGIEIREFRKKNEKFGISPKFDMLGGAWCYLDRFRIISSFSVTSLQGWNESLTPPNFKNCE